jgi:hydroxyethylthiazole kinase
VDSVAGVDDPASVAAAAARTWGCTVAITGERDLVSNGERTVAVDNGHRWLTTLTGTGCSSTTVTGAFAAVEEDPLTAAAAALACFGLAAENAAESAAGPASFKTRLYDALYNLTPDELEAGAKIVILD